MDSPKRLARIAGVLYLALAVLGGFAHLYARARVYVPGDAATTAANVAANADLVRIGVMADLLACPLFVMTALVLYVVLAPTGVAMARAMLTFVAIAAGMTGLNIVYQFAGLLVATESWYAGSDALVLLMFDVQHYGYLAAQVFFGLWLAPLGYLAYRSGMFPRPLGVALIAGCMGYLVDMVLQFLAPSLADAASIVTLIPPIVGELWMIGYLLFKGVRTPARPSLATATA
jgi:hypothetical protein